MKYLLFIMLSLAFRETKAQQYTAYCTDTVSLKECIRCLIEDRSKDLSLFPKPPFLTASLVEGVENDLLSDDSAKIHLMNLGESGAPFKLHASLDYYYRHDDFYTLLALSVHRHPDVRVYSLRELKKLIGFGMLVNDQKLKTGKRQEEFKTAIEFLVYVLENTPRRITGSENASIHQNYISNICMTLHLLTGEQAPVNECQINNYSDEEFENAIKRWKIYIKR